MKKNITVKDCTKENFEKSWKVLEDAKRAFKEKKEELWKGWIDGEYPDSVYNERGKILEGYYDAIRETAGNLVPYVGLKCSIEAYTDSYACVITRVITPNKVEVMHLKYDTIDHYACEYQIHEDVDEGMGTEVYSRRKNGCWYTFGERVEDHPCKLILNSTYHHIDPNF